MTLERCRMMMMITVTKNAAATLLRVMMISRITKMLMKRWRVLEGKHKGVSEGPTQNTV